MNYFKIASLLFVVTFLVETSHGSQVALTHAKQVEPIEFDIDDDLFIIHPDAIHIYNKYEVFLAPGEPLREEILTERRSVGCVVGFARIGTIYDKYHSDKKLTGEAYKKALATMRDAFWLNKMFKKSFMSPFKEIIQNNNIDINENFLDKNHIIMAIQDGKSEQIKILIELGLNVNEPYLLEKSLNLGSTPIVKLLILAGANIKSAIPTKVGLKSAAWCIQQAQKTTEGDESMEYIVSEIYLAREAEQMQLMHKKLLSKGANVKELANEIIEYLLGKNHKVMSMSACRKALENR